jgi:hypothetical protein
MKETCHSLNLLLEEADLGWEPDERAREHLRICPDCQAFYSEQTKLRQLMGSLGTIQAPADFDFRLKARLANERSGGAGLFALGGFSFGLRSAAIAALVLLLGAAFVFRGLWINNNSTVAVQPKETKSEPVKESKPTEEKPAPVVAQNPPVEASPIPKPNKVLRRLPAVAGNRTATRDVSSSAAPVVKREDQVANAGASFPIDASSESLKVSLDDASGVSRTISLPRVSFGSQRLVAGEPVVSKTSSKVDW